MSVAANISISGLFEPVIANETLASVIAGLGDVPLTRVRAKPAPGTATEQDVTWLAEKHGILCELVDGVLVEKPLGFYESRIATVLSFFLEAYFNVNPIGIVGGESGPLRTTLGQVRMPDVSVILCQRLTLEMLKTQKVLALAPDLAVEVLSETNTEKEMSRKLREYFAAGTRLVWYIDPASETAQVFQAADKHQTISGDQELVGGELLPGFAVKLSEVFARARRSLQHAAE